MLKKIVKKSFLILFISSLIVSCGTVKIPNTEVCTIAGKLSHGMICAETMTSNTRDLTFEESLEFLEASEDRGAALCQSSKHWNDIRTTLEIACKLLGKKCKKKLKKSIRKFSNTVKSLSI